MHCQRCQGFLVWVMFGELSTDTDSLYIRCINCGDIDDAVMQTNRARPLGERRATPRRRGRTYDVVRSKVHGEESASVR